MIMRKVFLIFFGILIIAAGGGLWLGYQKLSSPNTGLVLGSQNTWPAFWRDAQLFFVGSNEKTILTGRSADGSTIPSVLSPTVEPKKAAASPDQEHLVIVTEEGTQSVYWLYQEANPPKPIAALRGDVRELRFVTNTLVLTKERRAGENTDHLLLLDIQTHQLTQVAADSVSATWIEKPGAVISVDSHGYAWYHALQLSGKTDLPQLLGEAVGNVLSIPGQSAVLFLQKDEKGLALKTLNLTTKEQRLISVLEGALGGHAIALQSSPDGKSVIVILPFSAEQENGSVVRIDTETGARDQLPAIGTDIRWENGDEILIERMTAGSPQIWRFTFDDRSTSLLFSEAVSAFAS